MRPVVRLAQLNDIDSTVDAVKTRLVEIAEALKEPATLGETRRALVEAAAELARCRGRQADAELAERSMAQKLARAEQTLYAGQGRSSKEVENIARDVAQLRRQRSQAEDALLDALLCAEAATDAHAAAERKLARLTHERETAGVALAAEQATLHEKLTTARARQTAARAAVPAALLPVYAALRPRKGGRAVAALLEGGTCSACRVAASPGKVAAARDGDELAYCENCGRILLGE